MKTFSQISKDCQHLVEKLDWQIYHTPENLVSMLVSEVGELSELCVWLRKDQIIQSKDLKKHVSGEFADVVKAVIYFYNSLHLEISLETLITAKLDYENVRYPVRNAANKSKYEYLPIIKAKNTKTPVLPTKNILPLPTISKLEKLAWDNSVTRNWHVYYTPATLCLAIFEDCSKIYTSFQRRTTVISDSYNKTIWAIAGILILLLRLHKFLELDSFETLVGHKLKKDFERFRL